MFPQIFGKYVLEREIAAGGMARVFLATLRGAVGFEKRLVVKQIRPELAVDDAFVRRFVGEAKTAVELSHPNIVPVYELGVEQGVYYIAMEHCAGVTLAEVLTHTGSLDPEEGAYVGAEICRALEYAHRRAGIVHRDVTPRNVLLDDEGSVRLIDFGIAAPAQGGESERREVFGSPGHMPVEQLRGGALGPETDVFAVGTLLIEAWTGLPPFRRATNEESARALRETPKRIDSAIPALAPLAPLVASSVAFEAKDRPSDAEQLGRGLRDFLRSTDSVEVSRRLAARVRSARERIAALAQASSAGASSGAAGPDSTPPLVTPVGVTPSTATFAARNELVEWTRRFSSRPAPPEGPVPSTRRLSTSPSAPPAARWRPAATLVFAGLALLAAIVLARFAAGPARERSSTVGATLTATLPAAPAAAVSVAAVVPSSERPPPSNPPAVAHVVPSAPAASHAGDAAAAPHGREGSHAATAPTSSGAVASSPTSSVAVSEALLRLTSDPPGVVSVEGAGFSQTSPTPVRALSLPPGNYRVTFRSETYGAPVTTQVALGAGARRGVHADFRAAVPSITVR